MFGSKYAMGVRGVYLPLRVVVRFAVRDRPPHDVGVALALPRSMLIYPSTTRPRQKIQRRRACGGWVGGVNKSKPVPLNSPLFCPRNNVQVVMVPIPLSPRLSTDLPVASLNLNNDLHVSILSRSDLLYNANKTSSSKMPY